MSSKNLKGLTIKIGGDTSELSKSLEKVDKQSRSLSSELGYINRALKLDPSNTELLAQKQKVLAEAISNTEDKLSTLREAEKQVQAQFEKGEVSEEQVRALRREIIETVAKLNKYKSAAKETTDAVESLGKEASNTADEIEDQADETKKATKATDDLDDSAGDLAKGGFAALATAAAATLTAVVALAEESREYRTEMGKLNTAFAAAGYTTDAATKTYKELQSVIGETDQAVEAAQQIALLAESEADAAEWAGLAAGVIGRFGDALQPETFYEAANETLKLGTATGAYTQLLEGCGESVDAFNEGLAACSTEQEKQEYMLNVTKSLLGSAATQYKETNAEVIRANQATEKWNQTTAKIGKTVEPVVTDIKEFGAALLEDASEPLEDTADFIRKELLPALKGTGTWVKQNTPVIKGTLVGVTTALVAFKVATRAAEVAQKGLKGAIVATELAQKALALAQAATPWGLVATAVAGVTAALVAYVAATKDAQQPVDVLTEEERELIKAAEEAAESFRDQKKATQETFADIDAQMGYVSDLATELDSLADSSGRVKEKDQARAQFIIGELSEALGIEISMVDGVIQKYGELEGNIQNVILAKTANALIEAGNAAYIEAIQNEARQLEDVNLKEEDYRAQLALTEEKEAAYLNAKAAWNLAMEEGNHYNIEQTHQMMDLAEEEWTTQQGILDEKKAKWEESSRVYGEMQNTILDYQAAEEAAYSGNYQAVKDILTDKGSAHSFYSDEVDAETARTLAALEKEAIDAGIKAEWTKEQFQKGVAGFSESMVREADEGYKAAMREFQTAYADAQGVGHDVGDGFAVGMENRRGKLLAKARSLVQAVINAMRQEADSHSPAQKTIDFGEDVGEGAEIGIDNKTEDVAAAGRRQAAALLDEYRVQEVDAQKTFRGVAEQQLAHQISGSQALANASAPMLEKILAAIERGQVLLLDGDMLVGGTAERMDSRLGQLRVLSARGAR